MADLPIAQLNNKTPLQVAHKPNIDYIAKHGLVGTVITIPEGFPAGSDVANLSVLGYDPRVYYTGRSPIEAISMGLAMDATDVSFRCNLVNLSDDEGYSNKTMIDYSSDEISTEEASVLIDYLRTKLSYTGMSLHSGISYRHCLIWNNGPLEFNPSPLTAPHDILGKKIGPFLPVDQNGSILVEIMEKSYELLKHHPINKARIKKGLNPANSMWIWGEGKKPKLESFKSKYGLSSSVISAVDLIKGIGICASMNSIDVEGVTGNIHTNFKGKADAVINELRKGIDFIYVHIEAPDECGHRNELDNKIKSIELIDEHIVGPILKELQDYDSYRIMVLPDHPTPLALRTHTREPVPFAMYGTGIESIDASGYDESIAELTGTKFENTSLLMNHFIFYTRED